MKPLRVRSPALGRHWSKSQMSKDLGWRQGCGAGPTAGAEQLSPPLRASAVPSNVRRMFLSPYGLPSSLSKALVKRDGGPLSGMRVCSPSHSPWERPGPGFRDQQAWIFPQPGHSLTHQVTFLCGQGSWPQFPRLRNENNSSQRLGQWQGLT